MGSGTFPRCPFFGSLTGHPPGGRFSLGCVQYCSELSHLSGDHFFLWPGSDPPAVLLDRAWTVTPGSTVLKNLEIQSSGPMLCLALCECCAGGGRIHRLEKMEANRIEAAVGVAAMRVTLGHVDAPRFFSSFSKIRLYLHSTFDVSGRRVISNNFPSTVSSAVENCPKPNS
jgi:hypothetical protein